MKLIKKVILSALALAAVAPIAMAPGTAYAQDSGGQQQLDALEEIIVTARQRSESIQSTPVSISAYTDLAIEKAGINTIAGILDRTPSVQLNFQSAGEPELYIRGIGTDIESAGANAAVGFFVDDVYLVRGGGSLMDIFDLERIEVMRGPQGTYYGKNVSGGAINYITKKPSHETDVLVGFEVGNFNYIKARGMINGSLSDNVAGRISFSTRDRDGYTLNVHTGNRMDDVSTTSLRGSLLFTPSDVLSIQLTADTYNKRGGSIPNKLVYATDPLENVFITGLGPREQFSSIDGKEPMDSSSVTARIEWQTGIGTLTSITNFRTSEYDWEQNSTGNLYPDGILYAEVDEIFFGTFDIRCQDRFFPTPPGGRCWSSVNMTESEVGGIYFQQRSVEEVEQWSQQFRLNSNNDGAFNWMVGAYFGNERVDRLDESTYAIRFGPGDFLPFCSGPCANGNVLGSWNEGVEFVGGHLDQDSLGLFLSLDFNLTDTLSLTVGTRYSLDDKTFLATKSGRVLNDCACTTNPDGSQNPSWRPVPSDEWLANPGTPTVDSNTIATPIAYGETDDWDNVSSSASLNWQFSDGIFLYGLVSQGYKGGGWEGRAASGQSELGTTKFDEEKALNYELGMKADFWNGRGRFNISGFYTDYDGLQMTLLKPVFDPVSGMVVDSNAFTTNVGDAKASGVEIEFAFVPFDGMYIGGSVGFLDTEVKDDVFLIVNERPTVVENFNGNSLARSPESSYNINADYSFAMGTGTGNIRAEYNWSDEHWATNRAKLAEPSESFVNASFNYVSANGQWEATLWGKNLTDELLLNNLVFSGDVTELYDNLLLYHDYGDPRTYGISVTWHYD